MDGRTGRVGKAEGAEGVGPIRIEVVAHCLLNPLTRAKGLKPPANYEIKGPVIQLPCPEALYSGLDRWAVTKNQLEVPEFRRFCRSLVTRYADGIEQLAAKGFEIKLVGVSGSPSCGVETTSAGYSGGRVQAQPHHHVPGPGIFFEELLEELEKRGVPFQCSEV